MKQKKYLANRRWKYYGGTKKEGSYLFRQAQQIVKLAKIYVPQYMGSFFGGEALFHWFSGFGVC